MTKMTRQQIRDEINRRPITDFVPLTPSKGADMYNCPVCGSGTGRKKTGALRLYKNPNRVICYSGEKCFTDKGEDTLGALRTIWKCDETEAIRRAGYSLDDSPAPQPKQTEQKAHTDRQESPEYALFYREAHEALKTSPEALEYLHNRGITDESIERFNLGYCAAWKHSTTLENEKKYNKTFPGTRRIIIPRTDRTYQTRQIDPPKNDYEENLLKQIQGRQKDLFNLEALNGAAVVWICEGELDAISLYQAGAGAVVGIGTTTNTGRMLEEAKKHPETVYIIALDNDPPKENGSRPGWDAQKRLTAEMKAAGLCVFPIAPEDLYQEAKDANEAYTKNLDALKAFVRCFEEAAVVMKSNWDEERLAELEKRTGAGMLDTFLQDVKTRDFEPIPTGIIDIDRATAGGFVRRTLVLLSGAPGLGKTCLAQAIAENIAGTGRDCLFLNLEMDRNQLLARSLSRIAWTEYKADISPLEVLRGYSWTEEQAESITKAAAKYRAEIAPRMIYNPDALTNGIDSILQVMEAETMRIKAAGRAEPLIIIDYLNLIDSGERDATEGLKKVIYSLKDFAKRRNTVVMAITATNRAANKTGIATQEDGRDSSAVEYSGDLMLGLSYTAIEDGREYETGEEDRNHKPIKAKYDITELRRLRREAYDRNEDPPQVCNEISLKVLKNRFGEPEKRAKLHFDGRHNLYTMAAHGFQEAKQYAGDDWETITK